MSELLHLAAQMFVVKDENFHTTTNDYLLQNRKLKPILDTWTQAQKLTAEQIEFIKYEFIMKYDIWKSFVKGQGVSQYERVGRKFNTFYNKQIKKEVDFNWNKDAIAWMKMMASANDPQIKKQEEEDGLEDRAHKVRVVLKQCLQPKVIGTDLETKLIDTLQDGLKKNYFSFKEASNFVYAKSYPELDEI